MKSTAPLYLGLLLVGSCFSFVACGDDDDADNSGGAGESAGGAPHGGSGTHAGTGNHAGTGSDVGGQGGGESEGAIECEVVGELCHEADTGSGPGHDCHELGHVGDAVACQEKFADCVALCVEDDDGTGGAGGAAGSGQDPYCAALGELCHPVDDGDGPLHECHEHGHIGDAAACRAAFGQCAPACLAAREELEEGAGGSGGAGAGGAPAGEVGGAGGSQ